jgi:hypothetical protein
MAVVYILIIIIGYKVDSTFMNPPVLFHEKMECVLTFKINPIMGRS